MKESQGITILSTSAMILFALIILVPQKSQESAVFAEGVTTTVGDYILTTGKVQKTPQQYPEELLYVIDTAVGRMAVYALNARTGKIDATDFQDLTKLGGAAANQGGNVPPGPRGSRPPVRRP